MRVVTSEAVLLDITDLSDGDRIVTFLTSEHGCKRGAARGAKRKYSRFAGQLQPLATVQLTWFEKDDRDLVRIRDLDVLRTADSLRRTLEDLMLCSYLAEHVSTFAQENEEGLELYRLLKASIEVLEAGGDRQRLLRYFEAWMLRIAGVLPYELDCPLCGEPLGSGAVLPDLGETLVCLSCADAEAGQGMLVREPTLQLLAASRRLSPMRFCGIGPQHARAVPAIASSSDLSAVGRGIESGTESSDVPISGSSLIEFDAGSVAQMEELLLRIRRRFLGFELKSHGVIRETMRRLRLAEQGGL